MLNANHEPYLIHWGQTGTLLRKAEFSKFTVDFGVRWKL